VLTAAEASGGARACTEMATDYAKVRQQFGRPIGTFGPVKHHCANMLAATEQATAGAWGAARADLDDAQAELAAATACCLALPAFAFCAKQNIHVHGGIGYTWEHDAHLDLRRAVALEALMGPVDRAREDVVRLLGRGVRTKDRIELPPEADAFREEVRSFVDRYRALPKADKFLLRLDGHARLVRRKQRYVVADADHEEPGELGRDSPRASWDSRKARATRASS
jgi:hypothetical protein